jgi:uncharacterized membrane protein YphA (DoxX/SURF4 family)
MNVALWIAQGLLALLFLFAGVTKFTLSPDVLAASGPLPVPFILFIGVCEILGAIGLILPGLLRIRPGLTPLAAAGLVIIMIGAVVVTLMSGKAAEAALPLVAGLLAVFVAVGRRRLR